MKEIPKIVEKILADKAQNNNTIDLDAYANGLLDMYQALQLHKTQVSGSCNIYKLQCINEDGHYEENGYFFKEELAEDIKKRLDNLPYNKKYGIVQDIVTVEVL